MSIKLYVAELKEKRRGAPHTDNHLLLVQIRGPISASKEFLNQLMVRDPNRFTIITYGLISQRVSHETVIDAVMKLRVRISGIHFKIPRQGEYEEELRRDVRDRGCYYLVAFPGFLPFQELPRSFKKQM